MDVKDPNNDKDAKHSGDISVVRGLSPTTSRVDRTMMQRRSDFFDRRILSMLPSSQNASHNHENISISTPNGEHLISDLSVRLFFRLFKRHLFYFWTTDNRKSIYFFLTFVLRKSNVF